MAASSRIGRLAPTRLERRPIGIVPNIRPEKFSASVTSAARGELVARRLHLLGGPRNRMIVAVAFVIGLIVGFTLSEYRRRRRASGAVMLEQLVRELFAQHQRGDLERPEEPK
jgi:hypothetical protein